ncbi:hypothetical protein [Pilimelia anulata]|uniref:hypothetical protein n=1 Tax=Pilimelia anulata TaxID=53371 RepID=UPI00166E281D|nr:hypothetical protein [Pilimelia anulata]
MSRPVLLTAATAAALAYCGALAHLAGVAVDRLRAAPAPGPAAAPAPTPAAGAGTLGADRCLPGDTRTTCRLASARLAAARTARAATARKQREGEARRQRAAVARPGTRSGGTGRSVPARTDRDRSGWWPGRGWPSPGGIPFRWRG